MVKAGSSLFNNKRILMLQGPMGPFFWRFAQDLRDAGAEVHKINFNGGDWLFYPRNAVAYRGRKEDWPEFFEQILIEKNIDLVLLFGDCRPHHLLAHQIAQLKGIEVGVFEEGYVRPDYITFERFGANGNSLLPRAPQHYLNASIPDVPPALPVGKPFYHAMTWAILYYAASLILWPLYWRYEHHRALNPFEGLFWIRSFWRKLIFAFLQRNTLETLLAKHSKNYFIVPLQVYNDAQIHHHSSFTSVSSFLQQVIHSFATHADARSVLVIKHHPLDRGYHDYSRLIKTLARQHGIKGRIFYIHDLHMPTLFNQARGVVVINSTAGLSALHHQLPVKACGEAIYDIAGITYQGSLDDFWQQADAHQINLTCYRNFVNFVIAHTQLNGNYYKRLNIPGSASGCVWRS
jgi:capsular polysaccharide export protein